MNEQLILKFPVKKKYFKEDFYVSLSNSEAYDFIESWPKWLNRSANIFGPSGSGKSHLVSIFETKTSCHKINSDNVSDDIFEVFKTRQALILEDLKEDFPENILYSLFNVVSRDNKYLLITSKDPIIQFKFNLPDLISRVKSCLNLEIKLPTDDLINVILSKNFSDKQIKVDKKHIEYIIKHIDRSYEKILKFITILDNYSLKERKPFSLKIIKESLKMLKD